MAAIDPNAFRTTLGTYPTGVVIVSAETPSGPVGMAIGSFTSVSLEPALVGFLPGKTSSTWPKIHDTGAFAVNVLAADQLDLCHAFTKKDETRLAAVTWRTEATGAPIIEGVLSWIDCSIEDVADAGDHWWVTGRVEALGVARDDVGPLQFFRGTYGEFFPLSSP
jgi:flavin reductase (DIM6/NTAB) family NADH-FMN oxidoreductase RutF